MTWEGEMTKMKAVNLKKLYNFVVENLFWNHLSKKKYVWILVTFEFEFFKRSLMNK